MVYVITAWLLLQKTGAISGLKENHEKRKIWNNPSGFKFHWSDVTDKSCARQTRERTKKKKRRHTQYKKEAKAYLKHLTCLSRDKCSWKKLTCVWEDVGGSRGHGDDFLHLGGGSVHVMRSNHTLARICSSSFSRGTSPVVKPQLGDVLCSCTERLESWEKKTPLIFALAWTFFFFKFSILLLICFQGRRCSLFSCWNLKLTVNYRMNSMKRVPTRVKSRRIEANLGAEREHFDKQQVQI